MGPMSPKMIRGPAAMMPVAVLRTLPAAFSLLENSGTTRPLYITRPWRSPKPNAVLACPWLPGIGSSVTTLPVIASLAVLGVLKNVLGLKVAPPSMLALKEFATRAWAAS